MPRVHMRQFVVPADAIDANAHVNNKEYLRWMEDIAIGSNVTEDTDADSTGRYRCESPRQE